METWEDKEHMVHNAQIDECCEKRWCANGSNLGHQPRIYHICTKLKPRVIVETGMGSDGHGSSTFTFLTIAKEMDAELYSVDVEAHNLWFRKRFPDFDYRRWHFIQGDSVETLKALRVNIDFLHLDSGHGYDCVTSELAAAKPHLSLDHVIACHDTETAQPDCRKAMYDWAQENNYTLKQWEDWHGFTVLTNKPEFLEGVV